MLYGMDCECGLEIPIGRLDLGYTTCLGCGDKVAKARKFCVANLHKSNYILITDKSDLIGLNNKGGLVR